MNAPHTPRKATSILDLISRRKACLALLLSLVPAAEGAMIGQALRLEASASGTKPFVYQWYKDDVPLAGEISNVLSIASLDLTDGGNYKVRIANAAGVAESVPVKVVIDAATVAPSITAHPLSQSVAEGQSVILRSSALGGGPMNYQWYKDGVALAGENANMITLSRASTAMAGDYKLKVWNSAGSVYSSLATLTVVPWTATTTSALKSLSPSVMNVVDGVLSLTTSGFTDLTAAVANLDASQTVVGDFDYRLRVSSLTSTSGVAEAGALTEGEDPAAANSYVAAINQAGKIEYDTIGLDGLAANLGQTTGTVPQWFRFARSGSRLRAYRSADGQTWASIGNVTTNLPTTARLAPWLNSGSPAHLASASFSNLAVNTLPLPWTSAEVGAAAMVGSSYYENGSIVVVGAGSDIGGKTDQCRFVYIPASGDCEIVARLPSITNTGVNAKSGVMIRESLSGSSKCAMVARTPSGKVGARWRSATGGTMSSKTPFVIATPWVKVVRTGSVFDMYSSPDSRSWTKISSATISMTATVYVGLAVTSNNTGALCQAQFQYVAMKP